MVHAVEHFGDCCAAVGRLYSGWCLTHLHPAATSPPAPLCAQLSTDLVLQGDFLEHYQAYLTQLVSLVRSGGFSAQLVG